MKSTTIVGGTKIDAQKQMLQETVVVLWDHAGQAQKGYRHIGY